MYDIYCTDSRRLYLLYVILFFIRNSCGNIIRLPTLSFICYTVLHSGYQEYPYSGFYDQIAGISIIGIQYVIRHGNAKLTHHYYVARQELVSVSNRLCRLCFFISYTINKMNLSKRDFPKKIQ